MKQLLALILAPIIFASLAVGGYAQSCGENNPEITLSPAEITGSPGETIIFDVQVKNLDSDGCIARTFQLSPFSEGLNLFLQPESLTILPGEVETALLHVGIPTNQFPQTKQVAVSLKDNINILDISEIKIVEEPMSCSISVDRIDAIEHGTEKSLTQFFINDKVRIDTEVSMTGGSALTTTQVNVDLLLNGNVYDTKTFALRKNTFQAFSFNRIIDPQVLDSNKISVQVKTSTACDSNGDSATKTISFKQPVDSCEFTASVTTPTSAAASRDIVTSVIIKNRGTTENVIHYDLFMCPTNSDNCATMQCGAENNFKMKGGNFTSFLCNASTQNTGDYKIRMELIACGKLIKEESSTFEVRNIISGQTGTGTAQPSNGTTGTVDGFCQERFLNSFRCSDNIRQSSFQRFDCTIGYTDIEFCPFGCSQGRCLTSTSTQSSGITGKPEILAKAQYDISACGRPNSLSFDVKNVGDTDIFELSASGSAAQWVEMDDKVQLLKDESKKIFALVNIPCTVNENTYDLSISAKSRSLQTVASSNIVFTPNKALVTGLNMLPVLVGIAVVLLLGMLYVGYKYFSK